MKRWFKQLGIALVAIFVLAILLVVVANVASIVREQRTHDVAVALLPIPSDPASLARGRHLVTAVSGCSDCHAADLGGKVLVDRLLIGRLVASNLTRGQGGLAGDYTDKDLIRAIRHGIG